MRERRRLKLVKRQAMLAQIAQREAMTSLASTLDELAKSASLADRTRSMARDYSARQTSAGAADLRELQNLAAGLANLAVDAEQTQSDARRQADWQTETLAGAENRLKQLKEHAAEALKAVRRAEAVRTEPVPEARTGRMARKLHKAS
ncbi:MAG: hypothetical protein AAF250_07215 [Pseudomonadota bacterium]